MTSKTDISIFIDNTGHDVDKNFGNFLKERILSLILDVPLQVRTFEDIGEAHESDPNNENNTLNAISDANIVIPIISSLYVNYVTPNIERAINHVISSEDKYLFPILLDEADWSNHDWVVKSQVTPENADPLSSYNENDQQKIINGLVKKIKSIIRNLNFSAEPWQTRTVSKKISTERAVFISHDHDDADFAELLQLKLEKEGINSWIDTERLKIGQDWREEIDKGIEDSSAVIAIMTPEARKSEYVTYEWAFAWGKGKNIFPIMLKQTQLHPRLESLQYLNFTNNSTRPWEELIGSIKDISASK
ncbi:toll/interleukin-1 receptor domain-containing protein [Psychromonas sp. KJ10-2]|uniref:toll/interleukin-1 receptor domain-containing protein n=1 Tax=Psychromonas sp. KJ10-2 TaxID=3391822 RepID=UPI0039B5AC69